MFQNSLCLEAGESMEMVYSQGSVRRLRDLLYLLKKKPMLCIIHRIGRKKNKPNA
jgi:hypothetical protein